MILFFCFYRYNRDNLLIEIFVTDFKKLRSLEICGGGLTDAGVKNIKDLKSLMLLNLSQNSHLSDKSLEMISGILSYDIISFVFLIKYEL